MGAAFIWSKYNLLDPENTGMPIAVCFGGHAFAYYVPRSDTRMPHDTMVREVVISNRIG